MDQERMDKAYKFLKRAAELSPDDALILMQLGIMEMELQHYELAYELLQSAYSLEPNESEIVFFLAEASGSIGMMSDAKKFAELYIEMEPEGMYVEEAEEILDFLSSEVDIPIEEEEYDTQEMLMQEKARRFMEKGEFPQAIELLEELIERKPDFWSAFNNLALAYFYVGEAEDAKALLHQVLRENKGNLHAICNLAVMAYYEKNQEELQAILEVLKKIQPYAWEHRYKLGATLALIGEYELAFKWLRSMQKRGYDGDAGFYFWLSHSAYYAGYVDIAKNTWKILLDMDPDKEGYEPWRDLDQEFAVNSDNVIDQRDFIIEKLESTYVSDRIFGLFLLGKSAYKQEIIAHPNIINLESYNAVEKMFLAYCLNHQFDKKSVAEGKLLRAIQVAEELLLQVSKLTVSTSPLFQMWFSLCEQALLQNYDFKNPKALAAAADYLYRISRTSKVIKKEVASQYGISVATLTKYTNELIEFIPNQK